MLYNLCTRHNTKGKCNQSTTWSETLCISLRKDSVRCHAKYEQYQGAVALEKCQLAVKRDGGISQGLEVELYLQNKAMKGAMQYLY